MIARTPGEREYVRGQGNRVLRISRIKTWNVLLPPTPSPKTASFSPLVLIYGFAGIILLGAILLWLPISSETGKFTSFVSALFTSTSAVCVTGLTVVDTGTYWSHFGQGVILALIQIGGFGFMTSATLLLLALGRKIGLRERLLVAESMGLDRLGGLVALVKKIAVFTVLIEVIGAALLYLRFSRDAPIDTAIWKSIFHSVSAFNNAGFDIMGNFRSLTNYHGDVLVILVIAVLILLGGMGFIVCSDVLSARRFGRLSLDSKIVLTTTGVLLVLGMAIILLTEFSNRSTLGAFDIPGKFIAAFFQSVTPRTAGFSTINMGSVQDYTLFFTALLMFIGGAAGSTAGGIKVNTFGMLVATIWSTLRGKEHPGAYGREFPPQRVNRALALIIISLGFVATVVFVLTLTENFRFLNLLFETVSAFGTVGLSTGITPHLTTAGHLIIIVTMFVGRLGPLALILMLMQRQKPSTYRYPQEVVRIG